MIRQNSNLFSVVLSDVDQASSALPAVGTVITRANLAKGAVVLTDLGLRRMSNTEYAALANGEGFFIVQGKGPLKPLNKTPRLTKGQVTITTSKHKAAVQQITTIGYNGTTGSLPVANDTTFYIKLRKNDNDAANRSQPMSLFAGPVKTDASGTQAKLADLLLKSGTKNMADEPANGYVKFEVLSDVAGAVPTGTTTTFTATNNSKTVAINGTLTNVAVGDFIRFETATTVAVYKVIAYTPSVSIVLDTPFTGVTNVYPIANARRVTAALMAASNTGIVITGIAAPFDVNAFRNYYTNRFTATFSDESTLISHTQGAQNGNGVWQQVAMDEYMHYGFEGQNEMLAVPPTMRDQDVKIPGVGTSTAATSKYSVISLAWTEGLTTLVTAHGSKGLVLCYLNLDASGDLDTGTANTGETLAVALGLTAANLDE
jgi:hypothetical protein